MKALGPFWKKGEIIKGESNFSFGHTPTAISKGKPINISELDGWTESWLPSFEGFERRERGKGSNSSSFSIF